MYSKTHDRMAYVNAMEETIEQAIGTEEMLLAMTKALDYDSKEDLYEYIIRVYDIPFEEDE